MNILFHAHSGLRYLVLLLALVVLVLFALAHVRKQPFGKLHRALSGAFAGLVHTQVTLGLVMVVMGRFYPALIGHIVMMLAAAVQLQVLLIVNRKRPQPGFVLPLAGVALTLVLVAGGIMAIGRGLFQATAFAG